MKNRARRLLTILAIFTLALCCVIFSACKIEEQKQSVYEFGYEGVPAAGASVNLFLKKDGEFLTDATFYAKSDIGLIGELKEATITFSENVAIGSELEFACNYSDKEYVLTITTVAPEVSAITVSLMSDTFYAGESYSIMTDITPKAAVNFYDVIYETQEGAMLNGSTLSISNDIAENSELSVSATINGIKSAPFTFKVSYREPNKLIFDDYRGKYILGNQYEISYTYEPYTAHPSLISLTISRGDEYLSLDGNILTVSADAPDNCEAELKLSARGCADVFKTIVLAKDNYLSISCPDALEVGSSADIEVFHYPLVIEDLQYVFVSGETYAVIDGDTDTLSISEQAIIGETIVFYAHSESYKLKSNEITVTVAKRKVATVEIVNTKTQAERGEIVVLSGRVFPSNASYPQISYVLVEDSELCTIEGNCLMINSDAKLETIRIQALADGVLSSVFEIKIIAVTVKTLFLYSDKNSACAGDKVVFSFTAIPADAENIDSVELRIVEGEDICKLTGNELQINERIIGRRRIVVEAVANKVVSEPVIIEPKDYYAVYEPKEWSELADNKQPFTNVPKLYLSLQKLPENSNYTTLWLTDKKQSLYISGAENTVYKNLFIYYYNTDLHSELNLIIENLNIEVTADTSSTVFDFGETAAITMEILGSCSIVAGSASNYHLESFTATSSSQPMYGANGNDGGNCIFARTLTLIGSGNLSLTAGNGANGTAGMDGYFPESDSVNLENGTDGGDGGMGGDGGYAIYAMDMKIAISGSLIAKSGNAGKGGASGIGGMGVNGGANGKNGRLGVAGRVRSPLFATNSIKKEGNVIQISGEVSDGKSYQKNTALDDRIAVLSKLYYVSFAYGAAAVTSEFSRYPMVAINDTEKIAFMLDAEESALNKMPKNIWRELATVNSTSKVAFNFVDVMGQTKSTLGLTSKTNRTWLAYRSYVVVRNQFYTTLEQTALHEMLHLLTFTIDNNSKIIDDATYRNVEMNGSIWDRYTSSINSTYVYFESGTGENFISAYARSSAQEDVSETVSFGALIVRSYSCLTEGEPIRTKLEYMASELERCLYSVSDFYEEEWERWLVG